MSENDIVISGMSCRFPSSRNIEEFMNNLYDGIDMITTSEDRWHQGNLKGYIKRIDTKASKPYWALNPAYNWTTPPFGIFDMCNRMGRVPDFNLFDHDYFGYQKRLAELMDVRARNLLETTYEAIVDSGINPLSLRGTRTGVYVAITSYAHTDGYSDAVQPDLIEQHIDKNFSNISNAQAGLANRLSYVFDLKGPSLITDTACSSSLSAFYLATNDLLLGRVDYAIVGGAHFTLEPYTYHLQQTMGLCSGRGVSAVLDESADGFVKADGVACLLLQRRPTAKRIYSSILTCRLNCDGNKKSGAFFPSSDSQKDMMVMAYKEAGIDPLQLTYIEGHCTGTMAGDPEEMRAISNAYCSLPGRKEPLPLGMVKSNMGHTEPTSGLASLIKVILCYENESIPPNLNLKQIKHECKEVCPPLYPNTEVMKYKPGLAAINNFGIGGANGHIICEPNYKLSNEDSLRIAEDIPRIVNICGRTEGAVRHVFEFIEKNPQKINRDFLALLADTMKSVPKILSAGFPFRGSIIIKKLSEDESGIQYKYKRQLTEVMTKTLKPIWFLFPGLGGQWTAMAKALMPIKIFADKVEECHQILFEFGVDLKELLLSEDKSLMSTMTSKFCATTSIEIALFEVIKALDITPDGIIGHSFGEVAAAYADGCLTTRESMAVTYFRGFVTEGDKKIPKGVMAVCGVSKTEAEKLIPPEVVIACNNAKETVVISGSEQQMTQIILELKQKKIFVHPLESSDIPYHSHYLQTSSEPMKQLIKKHLQNPRKRSKKWISTSILESEPNNEILKYASAEYFVNNLVNPVYFYEKFKELPSDAIVVEIGPHGVFRKIVSDTLESPTYLSLIKRDANDTNLDNFFSAIASLYELGFNPSIERLYPRVDWPVCRNTASIGSLIVWDHSTQLSFDKYPDYYNKSTASDMNVNVDLIMDRYLTGHCIDGTALYPATGFLMLAWRQMAAYLGKTWEVVPVVFENVQFRRAVFLSEEKNTKLKVRYLQNTGDFVILENDEVCVVGKIYSNSEVLSIQSLIYEKENSFLENEFSLGKDDIYKELRVMGYDYSGEFQCLKNIRTNDFTNIMGVCHWNGKLVPFMDALLHSMVFAAPFRKLMVPVMITALRIDPKILFEAITQRRTKFVAEIGSGQVFESQEKVYLENTSVKVEKYAIQTLLNKRFCVFESELPLYFNAESKILLTHGIEMENIMTLPINRKMETSGLVLDSYEFIANEDNSAIDCCKQNQIYEYLEVCKSIVTKHKQNGLKCDNNKLSMELLEEYKNNKNKHLVMFKALNTINQKSFDENSNEVTDSLNDLNNNKDIDLGNDLINIVSNNERLIRTLTDIVAENNGVNNDKIKVTEINFSSDLLMKGIKKSLENYQLFHTTVDYSLVVKSNEVLGEDFVGKAIVWNIKEELNVEKSDLIIFRDTPELWELSLEKLLTQIREGMTEKGFLLTVLKSRLTEPELALNSIIEPKQVSSSEFEGRIKEVIKLSEKLGLSLIGHKYDSIATKALLFRKVEENHKIPESDQIIEISAERNQKWFELIKEKTSVDILMSDDVELENTTNETKNIWLIARDTHINGIIGFTNSLRLEPGGENIRCIFDYDHSIALPIDWNSNPFSDILRNDLVMNVIRDGRLGSYRHLRLPEDYDKTFSNEYFLNLNQTQDLSSLRWFDSRTIVGSEDVYDFNNNKITQVPIKIYSSGLTFHDVMVATGRIPTGPQLLFTDCLIGMEFAGRRTDTGERVMGFEAVRCFATSINANKSMITTIPEHWTMDDSITILSTYSTAWYGLIERAGLKRGEKILIHSGAGGVGQSAINICKHYDCDIFVTTGTDEKKLFLMKEFGIPENRIFSSRDNSFKYRIKELTKGKGVDIVLNSLAGKLLDASYECVANRGRFVELGKFDLAQNKQLGMINFLRDICFIGVAVDVCLMQSSDFAIRFFDWMHNNCKNGCVKPLNQIVFKANEAEKAFRYMTTGKHIGKIVIRIREEENNKKSLKEIKSAQPMDVIRKTYFDSNKVYIITGGLGGFGMELVHWMKYMGAKKFVLTSRSGLKTDYQKYIINRLIKFGEKNKYFGVNIDISVNDCFTIESTRQVIDEAKKLGQIGGVFHLTLVLNDCLLQKLKYEKFCESIDTKYQIFNNLDVESRKLGYNLDYFVVFSSMSSGKGNGGQTNYSFGNSLCERVCEQRRKDGLHGLAIQYGPVGDVGVFAESGDQILSMSLLGKQRINSCCDVLDKLLAVEQPIVTSYITVENATDKDMFQNKAIEEFWKVIGVDPDKTPDEMTLGEIGLESMFVVKLQQEIENRLNVKTDLVQIKNITVKMLKEFQKGKQDFVQQFIDDFKLLRTVFSKYKFLIPTETHTRLNSVEKGNPIYILPPFEITFSAYKEWAEKLNRPVIGLNWTKTMETLKDVTNYFSELLSKLEPNGKYDLVGYLDGALVISKLLRKRKVNKAVVVDIISNQEFNQEVVSDELIFDIILKYLGRNIPEYFVARLMKFSNSENEVNAKIRRITSEIKELIGRYSVTTDLEEILKLAVKRSRLVFDYRNQKRKKFSNKLKESIGKKWAKKSGKLIVIKFVKFSEVKDVNEEVDSIRDLYLLPDHNDSKGSILVEAVNTEDIPTLTTTELIGDKIIEAFE